MKHPLAFRISLLLSPPDALQAANRPAKPYVHQFAGLDRDDGTPCLIRDVMRPRAQLVHMTSFRGEDVHGAKDDAARVNPHRKLMSKGGTP
jgi:hypothetical protein